MTNDQALRHSGFDIPSSFVIRHSSFTSSMSQQTAPPPLPKHDETTLADVEQLGLAAAIASLSYVFWICGGMEMVQRLAYYGVKAVATQYAKRPPPPTVGSASLWVQQLRQHPRHPWALVQSFVPALTGGLSDRYGYKETIFASTVVKIRGLPRDGLLPDLLRLLRRRDPPCLRDRDLQARNPGHARQGHQAREQLDGLGHLLPDRQHRRLPGSPRRGPPLRKMAWHNVFFACAGIICCNFYFSS